ncbi:sensor histidine kinase [Nonomuraea typhae]|uniref:histidine kinase n=1 Tax=Nonomuraea typhae TaxID=2603600 RepID=A0ABW7Z2K6_9ACTN
MRLVSRWRRLPPLTRDLAFGAAGLLGCLTMAGLELLWGGRSRGFPVEPAALGLAVLMCALVVGRRRLPVLTGLACTAVMMAGHLAGVWVPGSDIVVLAAFVSAAYHRPPLPALLGASVAMLSGVAINQAYAGAAVSPAMVIEALLRGLMLVGVGVALRLERERRAQLQGRLAAGELEQRLRIAGKIHDVVGHHLVAIRMQAVGGRRAGGEAQVQTLGTISDLADEALAQVRSLLAAHTAPGEGLTGLPHLVRRLGAGGLEVRLAPLPDPGDVPPAVQEAAYHIVREALTNTVKHARGRTADVRVTTSAHALRVDVRDDGACGAPRAVPSWGVYGMRAKAESLGGTFEAGPGPDGWRVTAELPLTGSGGAARGDDAVFVGVDDHLGA